MPISKQKRSRRAELQELKKLRCFRHKIRNCDSAPCRQEVAVAFFGSRKKSDKPLEASPTRLDRLFYLIRNPQYAENLFLDDEPQIPETTLPSVSSGLLTTTKPVTDPRKLTLKQRIEMAKVA